jgi:hypothetical protein
MLLICTEARVNVCALHFKCASRTPFAVAQGGPNDGHAFPLAEVSKRRKSRSAIAPSSLHGFNLQSHEQGHPVVCPRMGMPAVLPGPGPLASE